MIAQECLRNDLSARNVFQFYPLASPLCTRLLALRDGEVEDLDFAVDPNLDKDDTRISVWFGRVQVIF